MISCNSVRQKILNYKYMIIVLIVRMYACDCVVSCMFVRQRISNYMNMIIVRVVFMYTCNCVISCIFVRRKLLNYKYMIIVLIDFRLFFYCSICWKITIYCRNWKIACFLLHMTDTSSPCTKQ